MPSLRHSTLFCALFSASAQTLAELPNDRDLIRERQQQVLQEQQKRLQELQNLPGKTADKPAIAAVTEGPCFAIEQIHVEGVTVFSPSIQAKWVRLYEGRCLTAGEVDVLLSSIGRFYSDRGFVSTRAYLPEQNLSSGQLRVAVMEGLLEGLDVSGLASAQELAMAFPGMPGAVLNLRELEQMVEQLNRLPSRPAQLALEPGASPASSRALLQGEAGKPWQATLYRHNDGQRSTGEQQVGIGLVWDSPLGLADQLSLRGGSDAVSDRWRHSANQSLGYNVPYGWWSLNYSYSQSYYRTRTAGAGFAFVSDGDSKTHSLRAERVVHRDTVSRTAASLGVAHLQTRNYLDNNLLEVSSQRLSESQLGINHGRRVGGAFINLDLGWQHGTGAFDAQGSGRPRGSLPVARYNKYSLTANYLQPFNLGNERFSFDSLVNGQRSEDVLFSAQRISLGGQSSVRGFQHQALAGDSGAYWRNQLHWRRDVSWQWLRPAVHEYGMALAYDTGVIRGTDHNGQHHGRLSGNAIEFSARGRHLASSLTAAQSLQRPSTLERKERPIYWRVDLAF